MTYAHIYAHEMRNPSKSSEIVLHLISCKSVTLLDAWNYSKPRFKCLSHLTKSPGQCSGEIWIMGCPVGHEVELLVNITDKAHGASIFALNRFGVLK